MSIDNQEVILTQKQSTSLIAEWAGRMNLVDWSFSLHYTNSKEPDCVKSEDPENSIVYAWCIPDFQHRAATIGLIKPSNEERKNAPVPYDMELSIVHELLHIPFALAACDYEPGYGKKSPAEVNALEQQINAMAKTLVNLKRRNKS